MTTSGTTSSQMSVSDIVTASMQELGLLSPGEVPEGEELEIGIRSLNWMLKSLASKGANLWRETSGTATLASGTATVVLSPYCLDVEEVRVVQSSTFERVLQRWEQGQYLGLPNKATPGTPSIYTVSRTPSAISMSVWPVPNTTTTIKYTYARVIEDVTDGAQTLDVPQEWTEAVYLSLASRIAQTFGVTRIDPASAQLVAARAQALITDLLDQDRPASLYMGGVGARYF